VPVYRRRRERWFLESLPDQERIRGALDIAVPQGSGRRTMEATTDNYQCGSPMKFQPVLCQEHGTYHGPPCDRCGRSDHHGADLHGNLTMFWRGGLRGNDHPTLCSECIDDIRKFAETQVPR